MSRPDTPVAAEPAGPSSATVLPLVAAPEAIQRRPVGEATRQPALGLRSKASAPRSAAVPAVPSNRLSWVWTGLSGLWGAAVLVGFVWPGSLAVRLRRLRERATLLPEREHRATLIHLARQMGIVQPIALHTSRHVSGAITAGIWRPFVIVAVDAWSTRGKVIDRASSDARRRRLRQAFGPHPVDPLCVPGRHPRTSSGGRNSISP